MSRRLLALAALSVVASATLPSASHAQLGKLTKKATQTAANAAGVPTGNTRSVKKIDLTSAQLAQVNKGLGTAVTQGPEIIKKWAKQQEDYDKAMTAYTKAKEKYDACVESEKEKAQAKIEAANKRSDQAGQNLQKGVDTTTIMAQAEAAKAAAERVTNGTATAADRQTIADFQKTMAGVQGNTSAMMAAMQEGTSLQQAVIDSINRKCGGEPKEPTNPASAGSGRTGNAGGRAPTSAAEEINQTSAAAAGMSEDEYRLLKEKAMGYAASNTEVQGGSDTPEDEAKSINSELAQTRDLMAQANKANVPLM
jgi:hypothetical protein